jgi:hypothetical protein
MKINWKFWVRLTFVIAFGIILAEAIKVTTIGLGMLVILMMSMFM